MSESQYIPETEPNQDSILTLRGGHVDKFLDVLPPEEKKALLGRASLEKPEENGMFTFSLTDIGDGKTELTLDFSEKNIQFLLEQDTADASLLKGEKPFDSCLSMKLADLSRQEFLNNLSTLSNRFNLLPIAIRAGRTDRVPGVINDATQSLAKARAGLESLVGLVGLYEAAYNQDPTPQKLTFLTSLYSELVSHFTMSATEERPNLEKILPLIEAVEENIASLSDPGVSAQYQEIRQSVSTLTEGYLMFAEWSKKLEKPDHVDQVKPWLVGTDNYLSLYIDALTEGPSITELAADPQGQEGLNQKVQYIEQLFQVTSLFRDFFNYLKITNYNPLDLPDFNQDFLQKAQTVMQIAEHSNDLYEGLTEFPLFISLRDKQSADWQELAYLADAFFHDISGSVGNLGGVAMLEMEEPGFIAKQPVLGEVLENGLVETRKILQSFDFREGKVLSTPETLDKLHTYLDKMVRGNQKLNITLHPLREENIDLSQVESQLNIPLLLRLLNNAIQNTDKVYAAMEQVYGIEIPKEEKTLDVWLDIQPDRVSLVFQDRGFGFLGKDAAGKPLAEGTQIERSSLDQVPYVPYQPAKGKTEWAGSVKGTGTGLAGLKQNIEEQLGGQMVTGTVINEERLPAGARVEVIFPIRSVNNPSQT